MINKIITLVEKQVGGNKAAHVVAHLRIQVCQRNAVVNRIKSIHLGVIPLVCRSIMVARPFRLLGSGRIGHEPVRGDVSKHRSVGGGEIIAGMPARPVEQGKGNAPSEIIIASRGRAAAINVSGGQNPKVTAKLNQLVIINDIEDQ